MTKQKPGDWEIDQHIANQPIIKPIIHMSLVGFILMHFQKVLNMHPFTSGSNERLVSPVLWELWKAEGKN